MAETQAAVMKYEARDGQTIELTFDTIRRYLVQGHPEYVVASEFMYFMGVCKSLGMNPFKKDCYLIKYTRDDAAAIITAIGFLRSRGKAQRDCRGWNNGIILQDQKTRNLEYREGTLILEGETLVGGWFEATPEGWDKPVKWSVPLKTYLKKKRDGSLTRFWSENNQPGQIAKVAEVQGLRKCWPDEFQNLYADAEISPDDGVKGLPEIPEETGKGEGETPDADAHKEFDTAISKLKALNLDRLADYVKFAAERSDLTVYELKQKAIDQFEGFLNSFRTWEGKNYPMEDKTEPADKEDRVRMTLEPGDLNLYDELKNVRSSSLDVRVTRNEPRILNASPKFQDWLENVKWVNVYKGTRPYPLDKPESPTTDEIAPSGDDSEPNSDDTERTIPCTFRDIEVKVSFCKSGACARGENCADYNQYLEEIASQE